MFLNYSSKCQPSCAAMGWVRFRAYFCEAKISLLTNYLKIKKSSRKPQG